MVHRAKTSQASTVLSGLLKYPIGSPVTRRRRASASTPVLIGAVTVLVAIVAVFLAYNANNGLPFVPHYTLRVEFRNAEELTHGADVHMGGALVGYVSDIDPARDSRGQPIAVVTLSLTRASSPCRRTPPSWSGSRGQLA